MPWEINIFSETPTEKKAAVLIKKIFRVIEKKFFPKRRFIFSIVFLKPKESQRLNRIFRKKNKVANVLTFPLNQALKELEWTKKSRQKTFEAVELGDIFLCLSQAKKEAKKYNLSLSEELSRLVVHGFLHLLGYTHQDLVNRQKMEAFEKKILETLKKEKLC